MFMTRRALSGTAPSPPNRSRNMAGVYLVRGGAATAAEGGPPPKNIIVVEFPSMALLREWYASPEYAVALEVRRTALDRRLIFIEGVPVA
jgi:uncharacterized protein (DUF1330 family)